MVDKVALIPGLCCLSYFDTAVICWKDCNWFMRHFLGALSNLVIILLRKIELVALL